MITYTEIPSTPTPPATASAGLSVTDYVGATDNSPFTIPSGISPLNGVVNVSPFDVNAHNIVSLGGFIVNLNGLNGFLN